MNLGNYSTANFDRGSSPFIRAIWYCLNETLLSSWLPGSFWRIALLRIFGADIESGAVLKPRVRVKFPWRLHIGENSWIGENVHIDNLATVRIGKNSCISQNVYLCTGSHNWRASGFDLITAPINISDKCWVGACGILAPGTVMEEGAILSLGSMGKGALLAWSIYSGVPAERVKVREADF